MDFLQNLLFVITGIIAIIGITAKTKKDDKPKNEQGNDDPSVNLVWYRLTNAGYVLLVLSCILVGVNILLQYFKNEKQELINQIAKQKADNDSMISANKNFNDSSKFAQKAALDSVRHFETLDSLKKQRVIDSVILVHDSLHYISTLQKFEVQLLNQQTTLSNINNVMHPIFPLKTEYYLSYILDENFQDTALSKTLKDSIERKYLEVSKNTNKKIDINIGSKFRKINDTVDLPYIDKAVRKLIPKTVFFTVSKNRTMSNQPFALSLGSSKFEYRYFYDRDLNRLLIDVTEDVMPVEVPHNHIKSLEDIKGDSVLIGVKKSNNSPFQLTELTLYCGDAFYHVYRLIIKESSVIPSTIPFMKYYFVPMANEWDLD